MTRLRRQSLGIPWGGLTAFLILCAIHAGMGEVLSRESEEGSAPSRPLQVFILSGQSNMQGHAHIRTFDAMALNPVAAPLLEEMRHADGSPRECRRVWISSIGSAEEERVGKLTAGYGAEARGPKIGPEFTFGIYLEKVLEGPILIIKTAWGGKSLHTDFRPPSAGAYEFSPAQREQFEKQGKDLEAIQADKARATGHYYRLMMDHVKRVLADPRRVCPEYDPEVGFRLAGFVWFQGWNDMVDRSTYPDRDQPGGYALYSQLLTHFIRDVRSDLGEPRLPFVIGVMGVNGPFDQYPPDQRRYQGIHRHFREAMSAPASRPEFRGNVTTVMTEQFWDGEVARLREREKALTPRVNEIKAEVKENRLSRESGQARIDQLYGATFNPREMNLLKNSTSNFDFHYMGSATIMAQIGRGFAKALLEMRQAPAGD